MYLLPLGQQLRTVFGNLISSICSKCCLHLLL
jgi:hypothetical protein